jgi:hypothetical protein
MRRQCRCLFHFLGAKSLAMRTIAAHLGSCEDDLKSEMGFDLFSKALQRFSEELFYLATAETDHVRVLSLAACLIIVLLTGLVHQIEFIDEAAFLEQLERSIDGDAIELRILFLRQLEETLGIQMLPGFVDQVEEDFALPGEPHTALRKSIPG